MKLAYRYIVAGVLLALVSGCANDAYEMERRFWQIQRQAEKIFGNPHASPPREFKAAVAALTAFSREYPRTPLGTEAEFTVARLCILKEEYDAARVQLKSIMEKSVNKPVVYAEALFLLGNSYELQDKWGPAIEAYQQIIKEYPLTGRGLSTPVYIAQHYKVKFQPEKMRQALEEAISHYQGLAIRYANTPLAFNAYNLVAQCYMGLNDWRNAVSTLDTIVARFQGKAALDEILLNKAVIYARELKDNEQAKQALEKLLRDYPRSRLTSAAAKLLKGLNAPAQPTK